MLTERAIYFPMESLIYQIAIGLPGLLIAIVFHEAAHAYVAHLYGDETAARAGRLTLNPLPHIDLFGTIIVPIMGAVLGGFIFGWAKPVPINTRNFRPNVNFRKAMFMVSFAGPLTNLVLAFISIFLLALVVTKMPSNFYLFGPFIAMLRYSVLFNTILFTFNLIPFPPLDGHKMLMSVLNVQTAMKLQFLERYSFLFFILLIVTGLTRYIFTPPVMFSEYLISFFMKIMS